MRGGPKSIFPETQSVKRGTKCVVGCDMRFMVFRQLVNFYNLVQYSTNIHVWYLYPNDIGNREKQEIIYKVMSCGVKKHYIHLKIIYNKNKTSVHFWRWHLSSMTVYPHGRRQAQTIKTIYISWGRSDMARFLCPPPQCPPVDDDWKDGQRWHSMHLSVSPPPYPTRSKMRPVKVYV